MFNLPPFLLFSLRNCSQAPNHEPSTTSPLPRPTPNPSGTPGPDIRSKWRVQPTSFSTTAPRQTPAPLGYKPASQQPPGPTLSQCQGPSSQASTSDLVPNFPALPPSLEGGKIITSPFPGILVLCGAPCPAPVPSPDCPWFDAVPSLLC